MSQLDARGLPEGYPFNEAWEITPREFQRLRAASERVLLVDVRTAAERSTACIAGSIHLPLNEVESRAEALREHEEDLIVMQCHHGVRSLRAAASLRRLGFERVVSLAGGIHLWSMDVDPSVPIY
jgi:rhodanese-related sulfurtransferase